LIDLAQVWGLGNALVCRNERQVCSMADYMYDIELTPMEMLHVLVHLAQADYFVNM
jgi:hypothetical protein